MNSYKPTIGIEVHLELNSNSKVFSPSLNNYKSPQNTNINEIDLAYPGVLPTVNKSVVDKAVLACLGLNMDIAHKMHFDRKNYFYPDLPKGYQITQWETPIGRNGYLEIKIGDTYKKIGIERIHIEEDTAKSMHGKGKTLLNYNRSGVPLIEIVSKPDLKSSKEATTYAEALRKLMLYLGVSDAKIEEGSIRFDVNVSVSKTEELGVRSEIKNIGSISNIEKAINYEVKRQSTLLEKGEKLLPDTRKYDEKTESTIFMRYKDTENDYRYFPEPDIPYLYLTDNDIEKIKATLPLTPLEREKAYLEKGISEINILNILTSLKLLAGIPPFLVSMPLKYTVKGSSVTFLDTNIDFKVASNILLGDISSYLNKNSMNILDINLSKDRFIELVSALSTNKISSKTFKIILEDFLETDKSIDALLKEKDLIEMKDDEIESFIENVLSSYPNQVEEYKNGKTNLFKFLMGMVMKESKGKINPKTCDEVLKKVLDK